MVGIDFANLVLWFAIMQNILHWEHFGSIQKVFKQKKKEVYC